MKKAWFMAPMESSSKGIGIMAPMVSWFIAPVEKGWFYFFATFFFSLSLSIGKRSTLAALGKICWGTVASLAQNPRTPGFY